jgi:hypothetical protein
MELPLNLLEDVRLDDGWNRDLDDLLFRLAPARA